MALRVGLYLYFIHNLHIYHYSHILLVYIYILQGRGDSIFHNQLAGIIGHCLHSVHLIIYTTKYSIFCPAFTIMTARNDVCIGVNDRVATAEEFDYSQRGQWLRAAVLGATDGLISVASLMMGVGAVKQDVRAMILTGFAGLVAGACSMAIGEFVSVYSQRDVEAAQMKRENRLSESTGESGKEALPNPIQAAAASAFAFMLGAIMPLLAAAFIVDHKVRLGVVVATVTLALVFFGWIGAFLGRSPAVKSCFRIVIGGWMAMAITFGLTRWIGSTGL
uniref:vacuolar iron transporter homolog 4-like n=1 Tax=Erigeron canadensis TaxID=72917 RepID=UPI001CB90B8B|nr:vacuolar iron transporter homolog 4-like [Erigeron canadensis]